MPKPYNPDEHYTLTHNDGADRILAFGRQDEEARNCCHILVEKLHGYRKNWKRKAITQEARQELQRILETATKSLQACESRIVQAGHGLYADSESQRARSRVERNSACRAALMQLLSANEAYLTGAADTITFADQQQAELTACYFLEKLV